MKKLLYYLTTLWLLLWFQVISNHFIGGTLFSVQWLLIAILHFGLRRGPWTGEWVGFIWGIFVDAASMGMLGIHAMLYALAGYAAGMLRRQLDASKVWTQSIFTWIVSMVYFLVYLVIERFFSAAEGSFHWTVLTVPLMNAFLAPAVFVVLERWADLWEMQPVDH